MNILAIDTSTKYLCIGITKNSEFVVDYCKDIRYQQSRLLLPMIKSLLASVGLKLDKIDIFGIGLGPGSFTGLRIGFSTIKGLNFTLNRPIVGIPSLDIIARNALNLKVDYVCPILDAKRGLVYACIYKRHTSCLRKITKYLLIEPQELLKTIKGNIVFLGDGLNIYKDLIRNKLERGVRFLFSNNWLPKAINLIALIQEKTEDKNSLNNFNKQISPLYLYPKECQIIR